MNEWKLKQLQKNHQNKLTPLNASGLSIYIYMAVVFCPTIFVLHNISSKRLFVSGSDLEVVQCI